MKNKTIIVLIILILFVVIITYLIIKSQPEDGFKLCMEETAIKRCEEMGSKYKGFWEGMNGYVYSCKGISFTSGATDFSNEEMEECRNEN